MAKEKKNRKGLKTFLIVLAVITAVIAAAGIIGFSWLNKEHESNLCLEFCDLDLTETEDGQYIGEYAGGLYGWRENRVQVTVESGKITEIELLYSKDGVSSEITDELYGKVIESQSLDVDAVSQATVTSKAYLKSIEDAVAGE